MFTVDAEYWFSCHYCRKEEIEDGEEQEKFLTEVGSRYAFISGLRILSYGDNSRRELTQKLRTKGHKPEYIDGALDKLQEYGYINDTRYARNLTDSLIARKHMSRNGIKNELIKKGIEREIIESVLDDTEFDDAQAIKALLSGKFSRNLSDEKGIRKTVAALQRLGYGWQDIKSALDSVRIRQEDFSE